MGNKIDSKLPEKAKKQILSTTWLSQDQQHEEMEQSEDNAQVTKDKDLTGEGRIFKNVITSWVAQFVFVLAGFIVPRMINDYLGQGVLGVWDFCWSLVAYFMLVQAGIVSSINRFVAKFRASNNFEGVNIAVSSVMFILLVMSFLILLLTTVSIFFLPILFKARLNDHLHEAQWVIAFLGAALAVSNIQTCFGGILTGFHRWDLQNAVNGFERLLTMAAMIVALLLGGKLVVLAAIEFFGACFSFVCRYFLAYNIFKGLHIGYSNVRWNTAKNMLTFGGKTFLPSLGELFSNQTISLMIVWFMGPATLALFARPRGLIRHLNSFVARYALVYAPTASTIHAMDNEKRISLLYIQAIQFGAYFTLPLITLLVICGGQIIHFWMGPQYANQPLVTVLALGYLPSLYNMPAMSVLSGMNKHGRPGGVRFLASVASVILSAISLKYFKSNLVSAAIALVVPLAGAELYVTYFGAKLVKVKPSNIIFQAILKPLLCTLPLAIILSIFKVSFQDYRVSLFGGILTGAAFLALTYWIYVLPSKKNKINSRIT